MKDDYLWDRSGELDPDVAALERALGGLRHRAGALAPQQTPRLEVRAAAARPAGPPAAGPRAWWWLAAAAAVAVGAWAGLGSEAVELGSPQSAVMLTVDGSGRNLAEKARFVAETDEELTLAGFGELTLRRGSDLEVQRLALDRASLYLHRGEMEAFVYANAAPGFFQVGTPAARCIDLGCKYTLKVDAAGDADVEVDLGQVAFRDRGREVYVPRDATCHASRVRGAGTPRFKSDAGGVFVAALDRFDAASAAAGDRDRLAAAVVAAATQPRHSLSVWHFLQDSEPGVASQALAYLVREFGAPAGTQVGANVLPSALDREAWKAYLEHHWFD